MPGLDGVEAIRQIVGETPAARIIALTMYRQEQYMLDATQAALYALRQGWAALDEPPG
jgi:DNA-binding NarL/FixJ family response regulator